MRPLAALVPAALLQVVRSLWALFALPLAYLIRLLQGFVYNIPNKSGVSESELGRGWNEHPGQKATEEMERMNLAPEGLFGEEKWTFAVQLNLTERG